MRTAKKASKKVAAKKVGGKLPGRRKILERGRTDLKVKALPGVKPRTGSADPTAALSNHWSKHPTLKGLDVPGAVTAYERTRAVAKIAEKEKEEARGTLLTTLQLANLQPDDKVACMGFEVYYTKGEKGRVSMERFEAELIQRGCPSDVLEGAREAARGEAPVTLQVRPIKGLDIDGSKE